jgi:hypothetical protein
MNTYSDIPATEPDTPLSAGKSPGAIDQMRGVSVDDSVNDIDVHWLFIRSRLSPDKGTIILGDA